VLNTVVKHAWFWLAGGLYLSACGHRSVHPSNVPGANAHRFVMAMQFGGCTDAEACELMRDRFCTHQGTGIELWDVTDVPIDRWFRDAWVRSHNGGPINVSLRKARGIQFRRITDAVNQENARRRADISLFDHPIQPDWSDIRDAIHRADDIGDVRRVWPEVLDDCPSRAPWCFGAAETDQRAASHEQLE
jgi:hypothetical protein